MKWLIIILFFSSVMAMGQTVIPMSNPEDASLVLLEVKNPDDADIVVYKTKDRKECWEWDLKWKFRQWGFCNFTVFITSDTTELYTLKYDGSDDEKIYIPYTGKVYFTDDKRYVEYKKSFTLPGVMKVRRLKVVMNF